MYVIAGVAVLILGYVLFKRKMSKKNKKKLTAEAKVPDFTETTNPKYRKD